MTATESIPLSSSEVANLWMIYLEKTAMLRLGEHFLEHAGADVRPLLLTHKALSEQAVADIKQIFEESSAAVPIGFTEKDVTPKAPKLFDYYFDLMFLHLACKIEIALYGFYSTMSYRSDIAAFFHRLTTKTQDLFQQCTEKLLDKGVLVRPPYMSLPKETCFVTDEEYMSGSNLFRQPRSLNAIESSLIHHAIESNIIGMQLMIGFAQAAQDFDAKKHFVKGMKLSEEIETTLGEFLRKEFIEPPATHAGKATDSTIPPYSDKLMMYITSLFTTFGLGSNALGSAFSLRDDIPATMSTLALKTFHFAKESGTIMIKKGWMEKPPQIEDRRVLTAAHK